MRAILRTPATVGTVKRKTVHYIESTNPVKAAIYLKQTESALSLLMFLVLADDINHAPASNNFAIPANLFN
jgi:hypothetical protein